MNFSLLDRIDAARDGVLATILCTEGHTYKKRGARALFEVGSPQPVWGNLGSVCVDQELVRRGAQVLDNGRPERVRIDTSKTEDADFGYGTYCGGAMDILVEPLTPARKAVYRRLRERLAAREQSWLVHDLVTGDVRIAREEPVAEGADAEPAARPGGDPTAPCGERFFVESIAPLQVVYLFGATPLARRLLAACEDMEFDFHVADWRHDYLDGFAGIVGVTTHLEEISPEPQDWVLILSHHFRRDEDVLQRALDSRCAFVGLLSSRTRLEGMFDDLRRRGVADADLDRVVSPIGLDLGGRSDAEIAVAIAAQLVERRNR